MLGKVAADFMRTEVLPVEREIYKKDWQLTRDLLRKAGELDLLRVDIPETYGGLGLDKVSSAYLGEQIGIIPSFAGSLGAHTTIGTLPLVYFGTIAQKNRYLSRLASGEWVSAFALTEPGSGSDALAARTRATLDTDGKHYLLNGQKIWITNGGFADVFTIFAKVDGAKFTAFIVEREMVSIDSLLALKNHSQEGGKRSLALNCDYRMRMNIEALSAARSENRIINCDIQFYFFDCKRDREVRRRASDPERNLYTFNIAPVIVVDFDYSSLAPV
jgi:alkylation response protein AidB-like acyl-CoA dehydrogenase